MKIVHTEASCGWGGQEIRILDECNGMSNRGHEVTLLCSPESMIFSEASDRNIAAVPLPIENKSLKGLFSLRKWLLNNTVDIINTHSSTDTWLTAVACRTIPNAPPVIRTRHISAPVPENFASRWLYTKAVAHVITTGEKLRRMLIESVGIQADHIDSVPTGVDFDKFSPIEKKTAREMLQLNPNDLYIGIVATLRSWKGHRYLLDAFSKLKKTDSHLLVVGDGPGRNNLKNQAKKLDIDNQLIMPGNQSNVVPWLSAMDIFVLPSYANEGIPQAIMQAMTVGLPVITTSAGSISEIIKDGETGIIVPTRDSEALSKSIEQLISDKDYRETLGKNAAAFSCKYLSDKIMLDKMESLFRRISST